MMSIVCRLVRRIRMLFIYMMRLFCYGEIHLRCHIGRGSWLTPSCIFLGDGVYIGRNARIQGILRYNDRHFSPEIHIGDRVSIQQGIHLTCANRIVIGSNTAIAANVTITDIHHPYEDIHVPIEKQDIEVKEVVIGEDCKIYNNSVILPGVHIGRHVTIGANSVVTKDMPDYTVAVGAPARIIREFDFKSGVWERVVGL